MGETAFGEFLHSVRKRTKGTRLAKAAGISYVYLLDLEKGARSIPSNNVLMALANNLPFVDGERERFFDLAAEESGDPPLDVLTFIKDNKELIDIIRKMKCGQVSAEAFRVLTDGAGEGGRFSV